MAEFSPQQLAEILLPGARPYVVLESEGAPLPDTSNAFAETHPQLDLMLEEYLLARKVWRGRAPAIGIFDIRVREVVKEATCDEDLAAERNRQLLAALVAHECAHVVEFGIDLSPPTQASRAFAEGVARFSVQFPESETVKLALPPMRNHRLKFIRLALHLAHRASVVGSHFPTELLYSAEDYGIAAPHVFEAELQGEPKDLVNESIFEIPSFRPPRGFTQLWNDYVREWISKQPANSPGVGQALTLIEDIED